MYFNDFDSSLAATNDEFANATVIRSLPFKDIVNTTTATAGSNDPVPSCGTNSNSVWYSFTPTSTQTVRAVTSGSTYPSIVSVWTGSTLTEVACGQDAASFDATRGTNYRIMVAGEGGGLLRFSAVNPPRLELGKTSGSVDRVTGRATLNGTIKCNEEVPVRLNGILEQIFVGQDKVVLGRVFPFVNCVPPSVPWTVENIIGRSSLSAPNVILPFGAGSASLNGTASGCGVVTGECVSVNINQKIQLKKN